MYLNIINNNSAAMSHFFLSKLLMTKRWFVRCRKNRNREKLRYRNDLDKYPLRTCYTLDDMFVLYISTHWTTIGIRPCTYVLFTLKNMDKYISKRNRKVSSLSNFAALCWSRKLKVWQLCDDGLSLKVSSSVKKYNICYIIAGQASFASHFNGCSCIYYNLISEICNFID